MTVFLLGPGRDEGGSDQPLQERLELARRMRATGTDAVVMEEAPDVDDENNFAKFRRLIQERGHNLPSRGPPQKPSPRPER